MIFSGWYLCFESMQDLSYDHLIVCFLFFIWTHADECRMGYYGQTLSLWSRPWESGCRRPSTAQGMSCRMSLMSPATRFLEAMNSFWKSTWRPGSRTTLMASRHQLQLDPARVRLVIWGSPRTELADGTRSFAHSRAAGEMKASTFSWLCHEWPFSAVAITYARHQVEFEQVAACRRNCRQFPCRCRRRVLSSIFTMPWVAGSCTKQQLSSDSARFQPVQSAASIA